MRNSRAIVMVVVSLIAGLMAIVFAARWLNAQSSMSTRKVAVAASNLDLGMPLTEENVKLLDWPGGSVPEGAFSDPALLKDRVIKTSVIRDQPILESMLAPVGTRGGLAAVIAPGKRAITVRVNDVVGVSGFALPGSYVDVIVSTKDDRRAKDEQTISKIVLERILVLAVGDEATREDTKPKIVKAVTLEVTPQEAESIDLARSVGQLSLVLRNQVDMASAQTSGITKEMLLGQQPMPVAATQPAKAPASRPRAPARQCVEVFMGNQRSTQCF